jgi:hypothetical protein
MPEAKDFQESCEFYITVAIKAASDLRNALRLDETAFRQITPALWQDPRPAFIYSVLDEVQKAGISIMDWSQKLSDTNRKREHTDHLIRLVTRWQQDEQSFRARKLAEILVDLICFSATNEPDHYRDYLWLKEFDSTVRSVNDQHEFFGFKRRNTEYGLEWRERDIKEAESKRVDVLKRWYLRRKQTAFQDEWKTSGVPFSSFRQRYIRILDLALPNELAAIGKSYIHAYGMSADIHFSPHNSSSAFDEDDIYLGVHRVGLLCYAILIRCQKLLDLVPEGINATIRKMHDENAGPATLVAQLKQEKAQVGDFVWAHDDICRVAEVRRSKFGYVSYRVAYVEPPPIAEIKEDWFAAFEIRLVATKELAQQVLTQLQTDPDISEEERASFRNMSEDKRDELLGKAVAKVFRLQQQILRDAKSRRT